MNILDEIIAEKKREVAESKTKHSLKQLEAAPLFARSVLSAKAALLAENSTGLIAEFKRKSPSKGFLNQQANAAEIARGYQKAGAAALSVLTDCNYFAGSLKDLEAVRAEVSIPILRKDFMIDPYQLYEAKAFGADFILLIAAALDPELCNKLAVQAHSLGLEVLLEVHSLAELNSHYSSEIDLLGVNNRDLKTFKTDISLSEKICQHIPKEALAVSESGLGGPQAVKKLSSIGFKGFLIGENFMKQSDPAAACKSFIEALNA